jgi:hypothetical protein
VHTDAGRHLNDLGGRRPVFPRRVAPTHRPSTYFGPPQSSLLRHELRRQGHAGSHGEVVITWTAARITLQGTVAQLPAGIDGEVVLLDPPVVCEIPLVRCGFCTQAQGPRDRDTARAPTARPGPLDGGRTPGLAGRGRTARCRGNGHWCDPIFAARP